jgi:hypothetical protein
MPKFIFNEDRRLGALRAIRVYEQARSRFDRYFRAFLTSAALSSGAALPQEFRM